MCRRFGNLSVADTDGEVFGMAFTLLVNNVQYTADVEPDTPLLWVLRDSVGLTGTKYGRGIGQCGVAPFCSTATPAGRARFR